MIILDTPSGRFTYWIFPGGRAELMEQARDTMLEETGLHVNIDNA